MATTPESSQVEERLRCGELTERAVLVALGVQAAESSSNAMFLSLQATREEIASLVSAPVAAKIRLTAIPSSSGVMYAVLSVQSGRVQWRHVVPLWDAGARHWLQDCARHRQRVSFAYCLPETGDVTILQWLGAWPEIDTLVKLADESPDLDGDEAKAWDLALIVNALAVPSAIQSSDPAYTVEEVEVVTHSAWLLDYLEAIERAECNDGH